MDLYVKALFADMLKKFHIETDGVSDECNLVIDESHPVLLRYDPSSEKIMMIATVDMNGVKDKGAFFKSMLYAGLNPLNSNEPGIGIDKQSELCFSYLGIPRYAANVDFICQEMSRLVEWNKQITIH